MVGITEALYRLRTNWSPASHEGKNAIVALPRPDVIAAYLRHQPSPVQKAADREAEASVTAI